MLGSKNPVLIRMAQAICQKEGIPYYFICVPYGLWDTKYGLYSLKPPTISVGDPDGNIIYTINKQHPTWKIYKIEKRLRRRWKPTLLQGMRKWLS